MLYITKTEVLVTVTASGFKSTRLRKGLFQNVISSCPEKQKVV